jgi:hypothetical protein
MGIFTTEAPQEKLPLQGIMESLMRGNAEAQAQTQVKKTAQLQAATPPPTLVLEHNPDDPGNPLVTIKKTTADAINQTKEGDLAKSYQAPKDNVEKAIAGGVTQPKQPLLSGTDFAGQRDAVLGNLGYTGPQTQTHVNPDDLSSWSARFKARRELGGSLIGSALKAGTGIRDKQLAEDLQNERTDLANRRYLAQGIPIEKEVLSERRETSVEGQRQFLQQKAADAQYRGAIHGSDMTGFDSPDAAFQQFVDNTGLPPEEAKRYSGLVQREYRNQQRAKGQKFYEESRKDRGALSSFDSYDHVVQAFGPAPSPTQEKQRQADWTAARQDKVQKETKEAQSVEFRQQAQDRADQRLARAIQNRDREKPHKMTSFDALNASPEALVAAVGDDAYDQTTVKRAIDNRRQKIQAELSKLDAQMKGNASEHDKLAPMVYDKDPKTGEWKINDRKARMNVFEFTRVTDAEGKGRKWATEASALKDQLAKLDAGAQASVGPARQTTGGKVVQIGKKLVYQPAAAQ